MSIKRSAAAVTILFTAAAYLVPLGARPLLMPDEVRYAEIPREMLASGDWIVPRLNGLRYFEKPVLGYWLNALSMAAFGENRFALRLPSAISAMVTAAALFVLTARFAGGGNPAATAVILLMTSAEFFGLGTVTMLDMPLTMFLSVGMVFFYFSYREERRRRKIFYLMVFGLCCGGAFLTKGFIGFVVPVVSILPFLYWERAVKAFMKRAWLPALVAAGISLPWAIMIHVREPAYWHHFFWVEHVNRFFSLGIEPHSNPLWYFIPVILAGAMPGAMFLPAAVIGFRKELSRDPVIRFAICWLCFPFIFLSLSTGKLATYVLPCFPPLALLITLGLGEYFVSGRRKAFAVPMKVFAALIAISGVALVLWQVGEFAWAPYRTGEGWKWLGVAASAFVFAALLFHAVNRSKTIDMILILGGATVLPMLGSHLFLPGAVAEQNGPGGLIVSNASRVSPLDPVVGCNRTPHAICWYLKRADVYVMDKPGELGYGLGFSDAKMRYLESRNFHQFIDGFPPGTLVTVVVNHTYYLNHKDLLPLPIVHETNGAYEFLQFRTGKNDEGEG